MKALILSDYFAPGYRAGGPIRSLTGIVQQLSSDVDFSVLTGATDLGETTPLPGIRSDEWNEREGARVYYASGRHLSPVLLRRIVSHSAPDMMYLNSFFSTRTISTLFLRRVGMLPRIPTLIAPRGEFSRGALGLKSGKKEAYVNLARRLGLCTGVEWHVSSKEEADDLRRTIPEATKVHIAPNLPSTDSGNEVKLEKRSGAVRLVFIARISRMKNLIGALQYLQSQRGDVAFHIYGPLEDRRYWAACQQAISRLPDNVRVKYCGDLPHHNVAATLANYHFLYLPTLGENFGHSIAEAMQQGRPVLISDRTPWRNLEGAGIGWDISLDDESAWSVALHTCVQMDNASYQSMSRGAQRFVQEWVEKQGGRDAHLEMFRSVAGTR